VFCHSILIPILNLRRLCEEGYFQLPASALQECLVGLSLPAMQRAIAALVARGHPASFFNLYDEAWVLVRRLGALMHAVSGNTLNFDMLSWYACYNRPMNIFLFILIR
jgi:hypothetical protein